MAAVLAIVSKSQFAKLRTYDGGTAAVGQRLDVSRYESSHPTLDVLKKPGMLFLVTVRPDDVLWLVAVLGVPQRGKGGWVAPGNGCPVVDLTPICAELGLERGDGKLAMRLQTPRLLDPRLDEIFRYVATEANAHVARKKPYVPKLPKVMLAPAKTTPAKTTPAKTKPAAPPKLPPLAGGLGEGCLAQVDEVFEDLRANPARFLKGSKGKRGPFTNTVQSIFSGAIDAAEAKRMLAKELAPFVDEKTRAATKKPKGDPDDFFGELVDTVAIRAIEDLCTGMLAHALGRADAVPATCKTFDAALQKYGKYLRERLDAERV